MQFDKLFSRPLETKYSFVFIFLTKQNCSKIYTWEYLRPTYYNIWLRILQMFNCFISDKIIICKNYLK